MATTARVVEMNTARAEKVRTEWRTITPDMATRMLEGNTHNRKVRQTVVERYASDMAAGRWRQTHQGIAFDEADTLIDGQHRLWAIIEANTPVVLQVTTGLPMESQKVVDDGIRRTVIDVMRVSSEALSGLNDRHASVAQRMMDGMTSHSEPMTRQQKGEFIKKHFDAIDFTVSLFPPSKRLAGVTTAPVLGAIARAYRHMDRTVLVRFAACLSGGLSTDPNEVAALRLRNHLIQTSRRGHSGRVMAQETYAKTERALTCFAKGQDFGRNLVPVTQECFPLR